MTATSNGIMLGILAKKVRHRAPPAVRHPSPALRRPRQETRHPPSFHPVVVLEGVPASFGNGCTGSNPRAVRVATPRPSFRLAVAHNHSSPGPR